MSEADVVEGKQKQREAARTEIVERASMSKMRGKKPAEEDFTIEVNGEKMSFLFRSIGARRYDDIVNNAPATVEQLARNMAWDEDKVFPALMAKVSVEPKLSEEEWSEIWKSPDWSRGELGTLFNKALNLCNRGMNPTPTVAD